LAGPPGDGGKHRVGAVDRLADRGRVTAVAVDDGGERRWVLEGLRTSGKGSQLVATAQSLDHDVAAGTASGAEHGELHRRYL
jgi:hypothetical protein